MHSATSSDDIRSLAANFRQMAEDTAISEYSQLMAAAALELERRAIELELPPRANIQSYTESDERTLTSGFGADIALLPAR